MTGKAAAAAPAPEVTAQPEPSQLDRIESMLEYLVKEAREARELFDKSPLKLLAHKPPWARSNGGKG